jgi:hypothetical protein
MIQTIDLPPEIPDKRVKKAAEEYRRLRAEYEVVERERRRFEEAQRHAAASDRRRYADALRGGGEPPEGSEAEQAAALVSAAVRREEELRLASERLIESVEDQRGELEGSAEKARAQSRERLARAVEELDAAQLAAAEASAFKCWVEEFPKGRYRPGPFTCRIFGLATQGGEPPTFAQVTEALRTAVERVEAAAAREAA